MTKSGNNQYTLKYTDKILEDLARISGADKKRILTIITERVALYPLVFGKPLQNSLSGLRSARAGDYRIIFTIQNRTIRIILIGHRSVVYKIAKFRVIAA